MKDFGEFQLLKQRSVGSPKHSPSSKARDRLDHSQPGPGILKKNENRRPVRRTVPSASHAAGACSPRHLRMGETTSRRRPPMGGSNSREGPISQHPPRPRVSAERAREDSRKSERRMRPSRGGRGNSLLEQRGASFISKENWTVSDTPSSRNASVSARSRA